jgi:hypothetical protein
LLVVTEPDVKSISSQLAEEGQVIIHCFHNPCFDGCSKYKRCVIAVANNIVLIPDTKDGNASLIYAENILLMPDINIKKEEITKFTLVFSALPKNCKTFSFVEPEDNGWVLHNIKRNRTDIYRLHICHSNLICE